jgi:hypothetical protein
MKKFLVVILIIVLCIGVSIAGVFGGWFNTWFTNKVEFVDRKINDATNYETIKQVEDTCRAMISSYESDKLTYEQYVDSENEEKQSWAEQAKMRANKTASTYNNYILENSFVWSGNVPTDIKTELTYLK